MNVASAARLEPANSRRSSTGLRERKKLATRDALVVAALALFDERGVERTTVEDIAAEVGVSPRTFHRYFTSKEDVLFADSEDKRERFRAALEARPVDEPLLESLRRVVHDTTAGWVARADFERCRQRLLTTQPALSAGRLAQTAQWQQMVSEHAATRLGIDPRDPLSVLIGACTSAAMRTALDHWLEFPDSDYSTVVDRCFALLAELGAATNPRGAAHRRRVQSTSSRS
jgi:AcrR family transcriptional regulator